MAVTLNPNVMLSEAQAQTIVDRIAPGRTPARISRIRPGEIGAVFGIALAGGAPGFVIKIYPESLHWKMQKEVAISRLLDGKLSVPAPRVVLADDSRSLLDFNFIVMTKLDGRSLIELEPDLDRGAISGIYEEMGRVLREIHRIPMDSFGYLVAEGVHTPFANNRDYMSSQFDRKLGGLVECDAPDELARKLRDFVERRLALLDGCTTPSLCHYDFHTGNLLAEPDGNGVRLTGIVDLENAIAGDPLMDIAKTIAYSVRGDDTKRAALLAGYAPIARPACQETVRLYELYGALELWCWWKLIGDHQRAAHILPDLERFADS